MYMRHELSVYLCISGAVVGLTGLFTRVLIKGLLEKVLLARSALSSSVLPNTSNNYPTCPLLCTFATQSVALPLPLLVIFLTLL